MPLSSESSRSRNQIHVSCTAGGFFTTEPPGVPPQRLMLPVIQALLLWSCPWNKGTDCGVNQPNPLGSFVSLPAKPIAPWSWQWPLLPGDRLATLQHLLFPDALGSPPHHSTDPHKISECPSSHTSTAMPSPNPVACPSCNDLPGTGELFIKEQRAKQRISSLDLCHSCTGALAAFGLGQCIGVACADQVGVPAWRTPYRKSLRSRPLEKAILKLVLAVCHGREMGRYWLPQLGFTPVCGWSSKAAPWQSALGELKGSFLNFSSWI